MADENKYNIKIECGTDFVLPFVWTDDNGNPVDLTGATVSAQLREYSGDPDAIDFICTHNNAGGRIMLVMPNELTRQITYSYGVYDVTVVLGSGVIKRPLYGEVKVQDEVTKPLDGEMLYTIAIESYAKLPAQGLTNRLYYVYAEQMILRWNGTNYVSALGELTVPGEHDSERDYPRQSIVSANGLSYISKIYVPEGVDVDDETYWMPLLDGSYAQEAHEAAQEAIEAAEDAVAAAAEARSLVDDTAGEGDTDKVWSADKVNELVNKLNKYNETSDGYMLLPIIIGNYITNGLYLPSSGIKIGDYFYTFDAPMDTVGIANLSNIGTIRKFDLVNNVEVVADRQENLVGHANSVAWDPVEHKVYIAPIWDYSVSGRPSVKYLYVYTDTMEYVGKMTIPSVAMSVTYDHVKQKLYYYDYEYKVWVYENNEWTLYTTIKVDKKFQNSTTYNQDFAVYDGHFFITNPASFMLSGILKPTESTVDKMHYIGSTDQSFSYYFTENEGMEFDPDGHLYALYYSNPVSGAYAENMIEGFVVEIPVGFANHTLSANGYRSNVGDYSFTVSEANKNKFKCYPYEIGSINQLLTRVRRTNTVTILVSGEVVDPYNIRITDNISMTLNSSAKYSCIQFRVVKGQLTIRAASNSNELIFTTANSNPIIFDSDSRKGSIQFSGNYAVNITNNSSSDNFINFGNSGSDAIIKTVPVSTNTKPIKILGSVVSSPCVYLAGALTNISWS